MLPRSVFKALTLLGLACQLLTQYQTTQRFYGAVCGMKMHGKGGAGNQGADGVTEDLEMAVSDETAPDETGTQGTEIQGTGNDDKRWLKKARTGDVDMTVADTDGNTGGATRPPTEPPQRYLDAAALSSLNVNNTETEDTETDVHKAEKANDDDKVSVRTASTVYDNHHNLANDCNARARVFTSERHPPLKLSDFFLRDSEGRLVVISPDNTFLFLTAAKAVSPSFFSSRGDIENYTASVIVEEGRDGNGRDGDHIIETAMLHDGSGNIIASWQLSGKPGHFLAGKTLPSFSPVDPQGRRLIVSPYEQRVGSIRDFGIIDSLISHLSWIQSNVPNDATIELPGKFEFLSLDHDTGVVFSSAGPANVAAPANVLLPDFEGIGSTNPDNTNQIIDLESPSEEDSQENFNQNSLSHQNSSRTKKVVRVNKWRGVPISAWLDDPDLAWQDPQLDPELTIAVWDFVKDLIVNTLSPPAAPPVVWNSAPYVRSSNHVPSVQLPSVQCANIDGVDSPMQVFRTWLDESGIPASDAEMRIISDKIQALWEMYRS